ncbi:uncharacterized protein K489DRAFT_411795 [Dissoconium aciculare CBS 342.82]|uniref:peptidylprolyl isomerase n=1 Tax=Dissoconium aciculare CBS 342.82 TaxID=1314786 RepID=A0A6J3LZ40_9PEZI|nr:uncharacterized protein K489DRAFT_411795 [Dissoconium aciculare CBS 342.82]KAF1820549.1 hypothetical protein K489DRAFT_411795 [Dissoconium aciculare CBS 342.82]
MRSFSALPTGLAIILSAATLTAGEVSDLKVDLLSGPTKCTRPTRDGDIISVNYKGTLTTGETFDESYGRGAPFQFTLGAGQVIKGWDQGLLDMCIGQSRRLTIPPELAYGDHQAGMITPGSTLIFETKLEDILNLTPEDWALMEQSEALASALVPTATSNTGEGSFSIATAPASPNGDGAAAADKAADSSLESPTAEKPKPECQLLGPFALLVQGALGALALLTLVWKRWRETPKRPWKIFIFDVSKQVLGSMLTHVINLTISMLSSVDMANAAAHVVHKAGEAAQDGRGRTPNPCSFYLLNLAIDTTLGVPILWIWLKVLHSAFLRTPLARPPASIKSGVYGNPPNIRWYGKQLMIYCIGLVLMKFCVLFFLLALPWLPWVGDWALRWTRGNELLEITFALFIFPLAMNAVQYWVIDNLIMDKGTGGEKGDSGQEYTAVAGEEDEEEQRRMIMEGDDEVEDDEPSTQTPGPRSGVDNSAKRK